MTKKSSHAHAELLREHILFSPYPDGSIPTFAIIKGFASNCNYINMLQVPIGST